MSKADAPLQRFKITICNFIETLLAYANEFQKSGKINVSEKELALMNKYVRIEIPRDPERYLNKYTTSTLSLWEKMAKLDDNILDNNIAKKLMPESDTRLIEQILEIVNEIREHDIKKVEAMDDGPRKVYLQNLHAKRANIWKYINNLNKLSIKFHYLVREPEVMGEFKFNKKYVLPIRTKAPEEIEEEAKSQGGVLNMDLKHLCEIYKVDAKSIS